MAGINDGDFALKLIPYGFDTVTLGGFNVDEKTIDAGYKIIQRGRAEFNIPLNQVYQYIEKESLKIKQYDDNIKVSVNLRSTRTKNIIDISKIPSVDIVEINCHCRQEELQNIDCGQAMLKRPDLKDYIKEISSKSKSEVSVKMRGNVDGVNNLEIAQLIEDAGADYLHLDAMKNGVFKADLDLVKNISENTNIYLIGNNSINSLEKAREMLNAGADGFSIARAAINGKMDFNLKDL